MRILVALSAIVIGLAAPALAADAIPVSMVTIPVGDLLAPVISIAWTLIGGGAVWLAHRLLARVGVSDDNHQIDALIETAISFGANAVAGARPKLMGETISVNVANPVLAAALEYVLTAAKPWMLAHMGSPATIAKWIWARMPLPADAEAPDFDEIAFEVKDKTRLA
jgi:hypothetical protein